MTVTDPIESRLRGGLDDLAGRAPAPKPTPADLGRAVRRRTRRRRSVQVLAGAACVMVLGLLVGVVLSADRTVSTDPAGQPSGVPWLEGDVGAGENWEEMPDWLFEFVTTRDGVPAVPVMADPDLELNETGVVCDGGPDAGGFGWAIPINRSTSCAFVFHYVSGTVVEREDGSSSRSAPADICLRHVGTGLPTPCISNQGDPPMRIPGTDYEAVIYRRNFPDRTPESLAVESVSTDWSSLDVTRTAIMTWRLDGPADVAPGSDVPDSEGGG